MSDARRRNRKHSVIDGLPTETRDAVETMLVSGKTYREIVSWLAENEVQISISAVSRYARGMAADAERLRLAHENLTLINEQMARYPDLDATEAIVRIAGNNVFRAIMEMPEERWKEIEPEKLLREASVLIKAAAGKKRVDVQNKEDVDTAMDGMKALVFQAMAKERPDLYRAVVAFLDKKQAEGGASAK